MSLPHCDLAHKALCNQGKGGGGLAYFINVNFKTKTAQSADSSGGLRVVFSQCSSLAGLLFPATSAVWLPADRSALATRWNISVKLRKHFGSQQAATFFSTSCGGDWQAPDTADHEMFSCFCFFMSMSAVCFRVAVVRWQSRTDDCSRTETSIAVAPQEVICFLVLEGYWQEQLQEGALSTHTHTLRGGT